MADLIGIDGRPIAIVGLALPFGEWIAYGGEPERVEAGAFDKQFPRGIWCGGDDSQLFNGLTWEHDPVEIAGPHRVSILNDQRGLWFSAVLPDTALGRQAAMCAASGRYGASVGNFDPYDQKPDGTVTNARIRAIGLTDCPAYCTSVWRSDAAPENLPQEARAALARFRVADMAARAKAQELDQVPQHTGHPVAGGAMKNVIHIASQVDARTGKKTWSRTMRPEPADVMGGA